MKKCDLLKKLYLQAPELFNKNARFGDDDIDVHVSACSDCQMFLKRVAGFDQKLKMAMAEKSSGIVKVELKVNKIIADYNAQINKKERAITFADKVMLRLKRFFFKSYYGFASSAGVFIIIAALLYSSMSYNHGVINEERAAVVQNERQPLPTVESGIAIIKNIEGVVEIVRNGVKRTFDSNFGSGSIAVFFSDKINMDRDSRCDIGYESGICSLTAAAVEISDKKIVIASGSAAFDFKKDSFSANSPFIIETPHGYVRIIGTRLKIDISAKGDKVKLIDGSIEIGHKDGGSRSYYKCAAGDDALISASGLEINDKLVYARAALSNIKGAVTDAGRAKTEEMNEAKRVDEIKVLYSNLNRIASNAADETVETVVFDTVVKMVETREIEANIVSNNASDGNNLQPVVSNRAGKSDFPIESEWLKNLINGGGESTAEYKKMNRKQLRELYLKEKVEYEKIKQE